MRTPITYYGGKQRLIRELLPLIPKHKLYIEPFIGGGALFFAKEPSEAEIINDLNENVTNFYCVAQTRFNELKLLIDGTLHSRAIYKGAMEIYNNPVKYDTIQRAWAFWVVTNQGFSGKIGSWGFGKSNKIGKTLFNKREKFTQEYAERLKCVQIENKDGVAILKQYDSKDSFFYIDPPYFNSDCGHYKGYTEADYCNLLDTVVNIKGKFLLSSYPSEVLQEYVKRYGWKYKEIKQRIAVTKNTDKQKAEVLVWNYELLPAESKSICKPIPVAERKRDKARGAVIISEPVAVPFVQKSSEKSKHKRVKNVGTGSKNSGVKGLHIAGSSGNFEIQLQAINPARNPLTMETLKTFEGFENMNDKEAENALYSIHTLCRIVYEYMLETSGNIINNPLNKAA